nr:MAG TPA_asm: hypothetical protein [Caudoviricetes sp.]
MAFDPTERTAYDQVRKLHVSSDVDESPLSQHHTLGVLPNQASSGDHNHDGRNSRRIWLKDLRGEKVSFPVTGGATGTMPTFNGAPLFTGTYTRWGNMVHFQIDVDMDNITNFGTGQYYVDLPFTANFSYQFADGCLHDISAARDYPIMGHVMVGEKRLYLKSLDAQGNTAYNVAFTSILPVTLATDDNFHIAGTYEIQQ